MHSLRAFDKSVELHPILYYLTRCSMPLFFMSAGAVQLTKEKIDYKYCIRKIKNIFLLMMTYYGCDFIIRFALSRELSCSRLLGFVKNCYWDFGVFWFLHTMIIIYIALPVIHHLYKRCPYLLLVLLGGFTITLDAFNIIDIQYFGAEKFVDASIMQSLRLWTWTFYYLMGGVIYESYEKINLNRLTQYIIVLITSIIAVGYMYWMFFATTDIVNGEYAYTSLSMMLWSSSLMVFFLNTNFSRGKVVINQLVNMLIPIYALHYTTIHRIVLPMDCFSGYWGQIGGYMIILIITCFFAYIITKKLPYMTFLYKI